MDEVATTGVVTVGVKQPVGQQPDRNAAAQKRERGETDRRPESTSGIERKHRQTPP